MKLAITALLVVSAASFTPSTPPLGVRSGTTTALFNARVDSSQAVQDALAASKKYGPTSKEARVAWDIVEELDASDNSAATKAPAPVENAVDYSEKVAALAELLADQKEKMDQVKSLAEELKGVKLAAPSGGAPSPDSAQMKAALAEAKAATEEHGLDSSEARLAWENVEEIAASDSSEATKGSLEEECLVEAIEACEAIEALQSALETMDG